MDSPKSEQTSHPALESYKRTGEERAAKSAHNIMPMTRKVLPFACKNYATPQFGLASRSLASTALGEDDEPGPSAA
jgi:hypothetical protein